MGARREGEGGGKEGRGGLGLMRERGEEERGGKG